MLKHLLPQKVEFFGFFNRMADEIVGAANDFVALIRAEGSERARLASGIAAREKRAEDTTHQTLVTLHQTFITPLDREDIHALIDSLDEVVDFIHAAAQRVILFEIDRVPAEAVSLATLCVRMASILQGAVSKLDQLKRPDELLAACASLRKMENEGDDLMRTGLARLFREEENVKSLLKQKELIEFLETATDRCRNVANIIEGIVLEYA